MLKISHYLFGLIVLSLLLTGCHLRPNWGPQGTIGEQRARAYLHDPFPSNELGPPIMGGRPLGYEQPRAEATHVQDTPYARRSSQGGFYQQQSGY